MATIPAITAPPCPECHDGRGVSTALAIRDHSRTLHFRCRTCAHEWERVFSEAEWQMALAPTPTPTR